MTIAKKTAKKTAKKLTKVQMRIAIAKDVISILKTQPRRFTVLTRNGYIKAKDGGKSLLRREDLENDAQLSTKLKNCEVCARGAIFAAEVELNNHLSCSQFLKDIYQCPVDLRGVHHIETWMLDKRLLKYFSSAQLEMIEEQFEGRLSYEEEECFPFEELYKQPKKRLIAIMENLIRNKGTFKSATERKFFDASKKPVKRTTAR